ncbi:hypothetical protein [Actinomycetospora chlora]
MSSTMHDPEERYVEDDYLRASAPCEAAAALRGLAAVLSRVPGVFADDARVDALRLQALADDIAGRWHHPAGLDRARDGDLGATDDRHWAALMHVYFRAALESGPDRRAPAAS